MKSQGNRETGKGGSVLPRLGNRPGPLRKLRFCVGHADSGRIPSSMEQSLRLKTCSGPGRDDGEREEDKSKVRGREEEKCT